jgi:hypothetical protein
LTRDPEAMILGVSMSRTPNAGKSIVFAFVARISLR